MSILPIVTYNDPILRQKAAPITEFDDALSTLIDDMFDTMYNSEGVGLAAPQIGESIRLFVMDGSVMQEDDEEEFPAMAFINPVIIERKGKRVPLDDGCLSIPNVRDNVFRPETIVVRFRDENFEEQEVEVGGWISRIIQHETDHLDGVLFIDYLSSFRKVLIKKDLEEINLGLAEVEYPI